MFPTPTAPPNILLCDCFDNVPGCGPVNIQPNAGGIGYTVSCPGPCPAPQVCELNFNGAPQGISSIDSSQIPPGAVVTCACVVPSPNLCPLTDSWCLALQSLDCQSTNPLNETCLPREVGYDPATGQPIVMLCDCFTNVPGCGPVTITANLPPPGYTASCLGPCPVPQVCEVHLNGVSQGVSSIDLSQIPIGAAVSCACVAPPPPHGPPPYARSRLVGSAPLCNPEIA